MPWKPRYATTQLEKENGALRTDVRLRCELQTKQTQVGGLKLALHQRTETIDALRGTIDQLRARNKQLDAEAEHCAALLNSETRYSRVSANRAGEG